MTPCNLAVLHCQQGPLEHVFLTCLVTLHLWFSVAACSPLDLLAEAEAADGWYSSPHSGTSWSSTLRCRGRKGRRKPLCHLIQWKQSRGVGSGRALTGGLLFQNHPQAVTTFPSPLATGLRSNDFGINSCPKLGPWLWLDAPESDNGEGEEECSHLRPPRKIIWD